ncbi:hypothetical protein Tco_0016630 [Tanacetum coccineum]
MCVAEAPYLHIKSVLTQKGLDIFCHKFHIPDDVHPQLPSPNQTIHEMPAGKIGVYTRFFEYANFRLPLSTFLVNVLRHYRINLSQLSVIAATKVSHFEILCRVHSIEPTVELFSCFYVNSKNKWWMSRPDSAPDPFPKSTEFSADDYAVLVAHPAPFQKFSELFLCLVGMSRNYTLDEDTYPRFFHDDGTDMGLFAFIQVADPTKVRVVRSSVITPLLIRLLLDSTGDFAAGGGQDVETELVMGAKITADESVTAERPKRPRKKRLVVTDASGSSHPPKKLRGDYGTSSGAATGGKSPSVLKELFASSMLNVEVGVAAVATLPLVTSSVFVTPKRESGAPTDSITGLNLRTIGGSERFVISSDSSHHSSTNASGAEGDYIIRSVVVPLMMAEAIFTSHAVNAPSVLVSKTGTKITSSVHASMFHDSDSMETVKADVVGPSYFAKQDLSMGSRELNAETLHQVFVPQWNVLNDSLLDDSAALFSQIREMDYHHLFTEFNVGTARQACLNAEVRMRTEYSLSERKRLESEYEKQAGLLKARDDEVENLKARLLLKETKAAKAARLCAQVSAAKATEKMHADEIDALKQRNAALENEKDSLDGKVTKLQSSVSAKDLELKDLNVAVSSFKSQNDGLVHALDTTCSSLCDQVSGYKRLKEQIEEFQDAQMNIVNDKVAKLEADLLEMTLHLEEKFYPHLLTTISDRSRAFEKGMHDGLSAGIDHGKAGRNLADVVAYNPAAEADYNSALQRLREVDFPLLAELSTHKDASTADIMDLLRLESPFADAPRMSDLQPDVEQLTLPIHQPEDQVVLGETSLSNALSVAHSRVKRIRENVAAQRSSLLTFGYYWLTIYLPQSLIGAASTSSSVAAAVVSTTALSTTFASASSVSPITTDDYEIVNVDGQEDAQGNVASFPTVEFEKEELNTTLERNLSS